MIKVKRIFSGRAAQVALPFFILFFAGSNLNAQSHSSADSHSGSFHKLTLALGQAHVHKAMEEGDSKWLSMNAWVFNYDYHFNSRWGIGLHNDIIMEDIAVEEHHNGKGSTVLERERPVATKLVGSYAPAKNLHLMIGLGDEITRHRNYFLSTLGLDYGVHLPGGFEVCAELSYDVKWHGHDTWILGAGISKVISGHHKHKG